MAVVMAVPDSYRPPRRNAADIESVCGTVKFACDMVSVRTEVSPSCRDGQPRLLFGWPSWHDQDP
jgi:hypothetical protein